MKGFDRAALTGALMQGAQAMPLALSQAQAERLTDYLALLFKWNAVYNLTAVRAPMQMVTHHLLDCLAAARTITNTKNVLDVGAGGGLPGLVLAIWAAGARPAGRGARGGAGRGGAAGRI